MSFHDQVLALGRPRTTKEEVMTYYRENYGRDWNRRLSEKLQPFLPLTKSGELQSIRNIERRHQSREGKGIPGVTKQTAAQYKALGETLPPMPPSGNIRVKGTIWVKYSEECVDRSVDLLIMGKDVKRLFKMAANEATQAVANAYQSDEDEEGNIDFKGPGYCHPPELTVTLA